MEIEIAGKIARTNKESTMNKLKSFLHVNSFIDGSTESEVRAYLLPFVENYLNPTEWILYDGNTIYNVRKLVKQFKTFIKFYDYEHFTNYLYEFFHLQCGSIAHYNKAGWLDTYPTLSDLKKFFLQNEYRGSVETYPPHWHYDALKATKAMHAELFGPDI